MRGIEVLRRVNIEPNEVGLLQSTVPTFLHENHDEVDPPSAYWPGGGAGTVGRVCRDGFG